MPEILSVKLNDSIFADLEGAVHIVGGTRNKFIVDAIKEKLSRLNASALTIPEERRMIAQTKGIAEMIDAQIAEALNKRVDAIEQLSSVDLAKLAISRLPKQVNEGDQEKQIVSLVECIKTLPGMDDVTDTLTKVKGDIKKLEFEFELVKARYDTILKTLRGDCGLNDVLREYLDTVYQNACIFVCDAVSRGMYPGFGDERGCRGDEYSKVEKIIKEVLICVGRKTN